MPEIQEKPAVYDLLFGVHNHDNGLYSAKLVKMKDGKISEWKHGVETSLGHACCIAENLLSAYTIQAHSVTPQQFYNDVTVV